MFALLHAAWTFQFSMFKTENWWFSNNTFLHFIIMICVWRRRFGASTTTTTSTFNSSRINWWQFYSIISIVNDNVLYGDFIHFQITALIEMWTPLFTIRILIYRFTWTYHTDDIATNLQMCQERKIENTHSIIYSENNGIHGMYNGNEISTFFHEWRHI